MCLIARQVHQGAATFPKRNVRHWKREEEEEEKEEKEEKEKEEGAANCFRAKLR